MGILEPVFVQFFNEAKETRSDNMDLTNTDFHKVNELRIKTPEKWNVRKELVNAISKTHTSSIPNVYVVYTDTICYLDFSTIVNSVKLLGDVKYGSCFELFYAITSSSQDIRPQQRMKNDIETSTIVVILESSRCPELVMNAVRQFTNGCLVIVE